MQQLSQVTLRAAPNAARRYGQGLLGSIRKQYSEWLFEADETFTRVIVRRHGERAEHILDVGRDRRSGPQGAGGASARDCQAAIAIAGRRDWQRRLHFRY